MSKLPELTKEQIEEALNSPQMQKLKEEWIKKREEELMRPKTMKLSPCCCHCTCGKEK